MVDKYSSDYCYDTYRSFDKKFPVGADEVSLNFTRNQAESIRGYCYNLRGFESDSEVEDGYSKPMVWIGIYISVASLFCILAMAADWWNGFRYRKVCFPSKYFSLNVVSIIVIAVAMKLPMDMNSRMGGYVDQQAKLGSLVFMSTMISKLMPSLASTDTKDLPANVIGLAILIITIIVNVIIQMITGVIHVDWVPITCIYVAVLHFLLIVLISFAISVPVTKQILELKYQAISKTTLYHHTHDRLIIERLRQHVTRYRIMVQTGSPEFVMARNVLSVASHLICIMGYFCMLLVSPVPPGPVQSTLVYPIGSQYKWSMYVIQSTQYLGFRMGTFLPINRYLIPISFTSFKVENYWTQKLYEWKDSHISFLSGGLRSRSLFRNLKKPTLSLWIGIQKATVVTCKLICYIVYSISFLVTAPFKILIIIPIVYRILVTYCSNYLNCCSMQNDTPPSHSNTNEYLGRYVLLLEENMELATETSTIKGISYSVNHLIQMAEKEQDNDILKLLKKSTGFEGVLEFDTYQVQSPIFLDLPNSWSLPIATLTCIAIALPNIGGGTTHNLFKSVGKALSYTHLVDESLNNACKYLNVQKAVVTLWDEVEDKCKWLGVTLEKSAY